MNAQEIDDMQASQDSVVEIEMPATPPTRNTLAMKQTSSPAIMTSLLDESFLQAALPSPQLQSSPLSAKKYIFLPIKFSPAWAYLLASYKYTQQMGKKCPTLMSIQELRQGGMSRDELTQQARSMIDNEHGNHILSHELKEDETWANCLHEVLVKRSLLIAEKKTMFYLSMTGAALAKRLLMEQASPKIKKQKRKRTSDAQDASSPPQPAKRVKREYANLKFKYLRLLALEEQRGIKSQFIHHKRLDSVRRLMINMDLYTDMPLKTTLQAIYFVDRINIDRKEMSKALEQQANDVVPDVGKYFAASSIIVFLTNAAPGLYSLEDIVQNCTPMCEENLTCMLDADKRIIDKTLDLLKQLVYIRAVAQDGEPAKYEITLRGKQKGRELLQLYHADYSKYCSSTSVGSFNDLIDNQIVVYMDNREHGGNNIRLTEALTYWRGTGQSFCIQHLHLGDYIAVLKFKAKVLFLPLVMERKTVADLAESMRDGRLENQTTHLSALQKVIPWLKLILLLEGDLHEREQDLKDRNVSIEEARSKLEAAKTLGFEVVQVKESIDVPSYFAKRLQQVRKELPRPLITFDLYQALAGGLALPDTDIEWHHVPKNMEAIRQIVGSTTTTTTTTTTYSSPLASPISPKPTIFASSPKSQPSSQQSSFLPTVASQANTNNDDEDDELIDLTQPVME